MSGGSAHSGFGAAMRAVGVAATYGLLGVSIYAYCVVAIYQVGLGFLISNSDSHSHKWTVWELAIPYVVWAAFILLLSGLILWKWRGSLLARAWIAAGFAMVAMLGSTILLVMSFFVVG